MEQEPVKAAARDLPFSYFKPARGNDGKADQSADDAGRDQIVLKQFDFCAQQGACLLYTSDLPDGIDGYRLVHMVPGALFLAGMETYPARDGRQRLDMSLIHI